MLKSLYKKNQCTQFLVKINKESMNKYWLFNGFN